MTGPSNVFLAWDVCNDLDEFCRRVEKRVLRVQRRSAGPRNPLRSLAARRDIQSEYFETKSASEEKHFVTPAPGVTSVSSTSAITITSKGIYHVHMCPCYSS